MWALKDGIQYVQLILGFLIQLYYYSLICIFFNKLNNLYIIFNQTDCIIIYSDVPYLFCRDVSKDIIYTIHKIKIIICFILNK